MQWMNLPASRMFYDNMYLTGGTSFSTTRSLDFLLDAPPSLAKASSLITIQWLTLPIMATQSDFHDLVGAACSQLSRNYSPCMYRKVLISSTTFGSHTDGLTEWPGEKICKCAACVTQKHAMFYAVCVCVCVCVCVRLISSACTHAILWISMLSQFEITLI